MFTFLRGFYKPHFTAEGYKHIDITSPVRLAKAFNAVGVALNPELPKFYDVVEECAPSNLKGVKGAIQRYMNDPSIALIRAKSRTGKATRSIRRNIEQFECGFSSPIVHMDIDGIEYPEDMTSSKFKLDITAHGKYCVKLLNELRPDLFPLDMGFVAKASGSAGIKKGIRVHMYIVCEQPLTNGQLKFLGTSLNKLYREHTKSDKDLLDTSVYDRVHLMYTSNPVFENSSFDPFKNAQRLVMQEGSNMQVKEFIPEYQYAGEHITISKEHHQYIEGIDGLKEFPSKSFEKKFEVLKNATDNVFMKHSISLYASAIEEGVDVPWLDTQVLPILRAYGGKRTPEDYIKNAKNAALKSILARSLRVVGSSIDVAIEGGTESDRLPVINNKTDSEKEDRFLHINKLPTPDTVTFVKASLGTGKTTTVQTWLSSGMIKGRFLAITNTVSLVEGNAKKLGAGVYNRLKDYNDFRNGWREGLGEYDTRFDRMSTTIHSLHRFQHTIENGELEMLFIDECDAVMNDILFSECIKEQDKCVSTLSLAIQKAKYVILSDGDVSPETIEAYARLCDPVKPINIYKHDRKMLANVEARELFEEKSVWAALEGALQIGEKCLLVSDCSPDELNEKGMTLRTSTGRNIKEVHKNSTKDSDIREILTHGNDSLRSQGVEGLLCSPSVTSGVDFSYFDSVFVLTRDSGIHTPNLRFQALRRDRGAKNIFYYTAKNTEGFKAGSEAYKERLGWLHRCRKVFAKRRERECARYQSTFRMLLRDQGARVVLDPSPWGDIGTSGGEYKEERIAAILSSTPTFQMKRHNDAFEVKQMIIKYYEGADDMSDVTMELVEQWLTEKPHDRAAFFHKVHRFFWPSIQKSRFNFDPFKQAIQDNPSEWYQATGMDVRTDNWRIKGYMARCGIKIPGEYDHIIKWYRTYCLLEGYQIPVKFMTEEELALHKEKENEVY